MSAQRLFVRVSSVLALVLFSASVFAFDGAYPMGPDPTLTPGALCTTPDEYRYPEHIAYCHRDVSGQTKRQAFINYDEQLGYHTQAMDRQEFKIDHFIPLCMGGANEIENLWPQHNDIYVITDPIEALSCQKMAEGVLTQAHAVELIRRVKLDLSQADAVTAELNALY